MAVHPTQHDGYAELRHAGGFGLRLLVCVAIFSAVVNFLMLTGPLFMLQVYDRVLSSRSVETLTALFLLVAFLFLLMGVIDVARHRIMLRVSVRYHQRLQARVFSASLHEDRVAGTNTAHGGMQDLEAIQRLIAAPVLMSIFDLPWSPLFLGAVFIFHPLLGALATAGMAVLVATTILHQWVTRNALQSAGAALQKANHISDLFRQEGRLISSLGMGSAAFLKWQSIRNDATAASLAGADRATGFTAFSRGFRLFLQSAMLAAGAWLVLRQELTPGAMIAASILMGRALAPIDQVLAGWQPIQRARDGRHRLAGLLSRHPPLPKRSSLPRPNSVIDVEQASVIPPGHSALTLSGVSFRITSGQALGVIGPTGSGKTTLAQALIGAWPLLSGSIRLDGAALDQFEPDILGGLIGYLPQKVTLFDGTIAENISRLSSTSDPAQVVRAAQAAAAHHMILSLPHGYDTPVTQHGSGLSGGQIQRIGLARALYGDPVLFVLDEPDSNLDHDGSQALNTAIRSIKARGAAAIIMAHRPAAINECDLLLVLEQGRPRAFGRRDQVLRSMVKNARQIDEPLGKGASAS